MISESAPLNLLWQPSNEAKRRLRAVADAADRGFVALSRAAGLDPGRHWNGANLRDANLDFEDLRGFSFLCADMRGAKIAYAKNIRLSMFVGARHDDSTEWPPAWTAAIAAGALDLPARIRRDDPDAVLWLEEDVATWADEWGRDGYGPWATFSVPGADGSAVVQRMRWCPPHSFTMGSPDSEDGRFSNEGPQRAVTFTRGYWMFDTACTKALWRAVTGRAPKPARRPAFPVTEVSWADAQDFVAQLNAARPGLGVSLPSESQWEAACRAGSVTAYSFGAAVDRTQVNFASRGPVAVGSLPANEWGLFEMHGNVLEWCADTWHDNYKGAPTDGTAWIDQAAALRVIRGGSWLDDARDVRAAYRFVRDPAHRNGDLGFRCARVQVERPASGAERAAAPRVRRKRLEKPAWASSIGRDGFGIFTTITLPGSAVTQRLRWCPPGRFVMGSPDAEPGRYGAEGPRQEVVFADGFWLFDTPCTQALWEAVMGGNDSRFQDPERPVETVGYDEAQDFLERLNDLVPGLNLVLPSEAEWEYACRGGTEEATWAGPMEILGERNAPVLDAIAWYGGNSGVEFDRDDGFDSSGWLEKQHEHSRAGTRKVATKQANPWGFHDMLGNVWEWCADDWHASYAGAPKDGTAWLDDGAGAAAGRVVRGGSWDNDARYVRAASRDDLDPANRYDNLGFRCARVQSESEAERRAGRRKRGERSEPVAPAGPQRGGEGSSHRPKGG